ncbi:hypothetical protein OG481_02050 [Streptomyces longwoodensis]|uniref:hypothetical protein n=1 Tax=Streptomyces longwoodensis TaxID=68231 RepID=UPI002DD7D762|nr:hypothetical protein [Streptomyces longwoodensis]WRY87375.1 hypothetical protein OG481_02050 [Streptomyces longwoodensis]
MSALDKLLDRLLGNDHARAATKYAGRESATDRAARKRREGHHRRGADRAAAKGQAWEDRTHQGIRTGRYRQGGEG